MEGVQSFGHSWSAISARIPGRPPLTCRNRWRVVSKRSLAGSPDAGNARRKSTRITAPDTFRRQSVTDNETNSQSADVDSQSAAGVGNEKDPPNPEVETEPFLSSFSAATRDDLGTNSTFEDMSHSFDSFLHEFYESQSTSSILPDLSSTVGLPEGSPGPTVVSDQSLREAFPGSAQTFDQSRNVERRAELEAETAATRHDTGTAQIITENMARSDQSESHSDWNLGQLDGLDGSLTALPLPDVLGRSAPVRRSPAREIHHHHHHHYYHHHYHHHHYHR